MNKRELIEHINNTLFDNLKNTLFTEPTISITESAKDNKVAIMFETYQGGVFLGGMLKKFEKVTIPQFVADWIEECKDDDFHLFGAMEGISSNQKKLDYWFREDDNMELFARAWLDGYEVEEKRYKVVMPNVSSSGGVLTRIKHDDSWIWIDTLGTIVEGRTHTRKELEQDGFGWVFDCPGIEIEEVEG